MAKWRKKFQTCGKFIIIIPNLFSACCNKIQVVGGGDAKAQLPLIFTTFTIEKDFINGYVHYTSNNGKKTVAYNDEHNEWKIQPISNKY